MNSWLFRFYYRCPEALLELLPQHESSRCPPQISPQGLVQSTNPNLGLQDHTLQRSYRHLLLTSWQLPPRIGKNRTRKMKTNQRKLAPWHCLLGRYGGSEGKCHFCDSGLCRPDLNNILPLFGVHFFVKFCI